MMLNMSCPEAIDVLLTRRSVKKADMAAPGPDDAAMTQILTAGMRVPDHGKLTPWRFFVFRGEALPALAANISRIFEDEEPNATPAQKHKMANFAISAPALVVVASTPSDLKPIPVWEQQLSAGASAMSMLVAAHILGYVGQWLTDWPAFSPGVKALFGLGADDRIAGFLFFGSQQQEPAERPRPDMATMVRFFDSADDLATMTGMTATPVKD